MNPRQSPGRDRNAAMPAGRPDATTSEEDVRRTGKQSVTKAGPDGPSAAEVGDTFKKRPDADGGE